jgi:hypothetical protein
MDQSPRQGDHRTGGVAAGARTEAMVAATLEFPPSSPGNAQAVAAVRVEYAREGASLGETAPTLLMDKLGERLAFERAGARLYEALLSKHEAYGSFEGGPGPDDLLHILHEEYQHGDILAEAITALGGDPAALTPSANLAARISAGLPQVLADPRTNLLQSLEAIAVAELADNEGWSALATLSEQAGQDELAARCREAIERERDHLRNVRGWLAAGQGRAGTDGAGADPPPEGEEAPAEEEFTFTAEGRVDREGYIISQEETEAGDSAARPPAPGKRRPRRGR